MDGLAETILQLIPEDNSTAFGLWVDRLHVDMPLELYVRCREGRWALESSAPTQRIKTAVLPVFHRVAINLQASSHDAYNASAEEAKSD